MEPVNLDFIIPPHLQREFFFQTAGTHPPNGILFGFNTVKKVGELAGKLGGKRALLVTDEVIVRMGFADLVIAAMEKEGIKVHVFDKVEPEPHIETANDLYETVRKESSDLVVGLGGGSSLDMAKLLARGWKLLGSISSFGGQLGGASWPTSSTRLSEIHGVNPAEKSPTKKINQWKK